MALEVTLLLSLSCTLTGASQLPLVFNLCKPAPHTRCVPCTTSNNLKRESEGQTAADTLMYVQHFA